MKKIIFISLIFLSLKSFSQGIDLGIKVGANFTTLTDFPNVDTKTGLNLGAFFTIKFNDKIAIQADALYSQQSERTHRKTHHVHGGAHPRNESFVRIETEQNAQLF